MENKRIIFMDQEKKIYIIGAGISGLIAALVLESKGYSPIILEKDVVSGGRLQTFEHEGVPLDFGFQVLLDAYPMAKKYLDLDALQLEEFLPGAVIFTPNGKKIIGDPLRKFSLLFPTLFSGIGTFGDKMKILKLNKELKKMSVEEIFELEEQTTLTYLKDFGFSEAMIHSFFRPFFSGIFLETELATSCRMFAFVYKMFGEGNATIPRSGIQAIPKQLEEKLDTTTIKYKQDVSSITNEKITLANGEILPHDGVIIATEASHFISNLKNQGTNWKSCDCLYFETPERNIDKALIGLIPEVKSLINNISYLSRKNKKTGNHILSVTVIQEHTFSHDELIEEVISALRTYCAIENATFIKRFEIKKALPDLEQLNYKTEPSETQLLPNVFLAGDQLLYGSLNAAMQSGESAALGLVEKREGNFGLDS